LVQLVRVVSNRMVQVYHLKPAGSLDMRSRPEIIDAYQVVARHQLGGVLAAIASDPAGRIEAAFEPDGIAEQVQANGT
jgi:hypothetical protein